MNATPETYTTARDELAHRIDLCGDGSVQDAWEVFQQEHAALLQRWTDKLFALNAEVTDAEGFFVVGQIGGKPLASVDSKRLERAKGAVRHVIERRLCSGRGDGDQP